ncbi:unnamed protein product [Clonostachys chloroleuca]|uniref:Cytochrome P450 n=1 Tax=Clonostachys chloroleuca TaxID=1926264 RepID=A0AA35VQY8_9HYPO|nr:unnamed protein product [Clonostachys chloroleuca]
MLTAVIYDLLGPSSFFGLCILLTILSSVIYMFCSSIFGDTVKFPKSLPLIRERPSSSRFSIRTRLSYYLNCTSMYNEIWKKISQFSSKGIPVLAPSLGSRKEIFLPHKSIKWFMSQPKEVLGMWEGFNEVFQLRHSLGHEKYMLDTWAVDVSRRVMTQDLEEFIDPMREELELAINSILGMDTETWKPLDLKDTMRTIINRSASRFVVGLPLCRDDGYLNSSLNSIESIVSAAGALGIMPSFIRPLLGRLSTYTALKRLESRCRTVLQDRFAHIAKNPDDRSQDPVDLLQRMLRVASVNRPEEMNVPSMIRRLVMANLGFIFQAGFAGTNVIRNILESDPKHDTINILREEAQRFRDASGGDPSHLWTRSNISRMIFADSAARETLRIHTFTSRAMVRQVMVDGLHSDTGMPLPRGSLLSFVSQPMHTDPDHFPDPHSYEPFRFVKLRNEEDIRAKEASQQPDQNDEFADKARNDAGGNWNPHAFISTARLLIFGRGRTSCPGRFLVEFQLKILIYNLMLNYDIRFADEIDQRPTNIWICEFLFPRKGVKILVKRRTGTHDI